MSADRLEPIAEPVGEYASKSVVQLENDLRRDVLSVLGVVNGLLGLVAAVVFGLLPGGKFSAVILLIGSTLCFGVTWLARRDHLTEAAILLCGLFWITLMAEPALTGDLSTNALFMGLLAALMAVSFSQRLLWLSLPVAMASVGLLALITSPERTRPVPWVVSMANGTFLTLATSTAVGIVLWQSGRQLLAEALANRAVRDNIDSLRATNAGLEREVDEQTAHLRAALEERRFAAQALRQWTNTDTLTGLVSRRGLDDETMRLSAQPELPAVSVIVIDLDDFKSINDTLSHQVGDEVLRRLGEILNDATGTDDTVARFGGEEFIIITHDADSAPALAERVRARIADENWEWLADDLAVSASLGVSFTHDPRRGDPQSVSDTILRAFQAMGAAKARGGNQVEIR